MLIVKRLLLGDIFSIVVDSRPTDSRFSLAVKSDFDEIDRFLRRRGFTTSAAADDGSL